MTLKEEMFALGDRAKAAARSLTLLSTEDKNRILKSMADALTRAAPAIITANATDLQDAQAAGLSTALLDRLRLDQGRITAMVQGIEQVIALPDPVGRKLGTFKHKKGMTIDRVAVPIGVIGIIYESRPNVTADAAVLCFKAGNAVILRGGKEARHSNRAIADALLEGGRAAGLVDGALELIDTSDREAVRELVQLTGKVDLIIPRGGESLINAVTQMAHVPVIKHYKGVCHTYVDETADLPMALAICENAKCQRPGVCNAMETLLVHSAIAETFLGHLLPMMADRGVELRGDRRTVEIAQQIAVDIAPADESDWDREYLDLILSVAVVDNVHEAVEHIARHGSQHSDAIIAESETAQTLFVQQVDAAAVYINASTRFTDGGEFGMGAEIGISTDKLHARGPMGLNELTTYKYVIRGDGQIR